MPIIRGSGAQHRWVQVPIVKGLSWHNVARRGGAWQDTDIRGGCVAAASGRVPLHKKSRHSGQGERQCISGSDSPPSISSSFAEPVVIMMTSWRA